MNFWAPITDSLAYRTDFLEQRKAVQSYTPNLISREKPLKRIICSCCGAHLGYAYGDGPFPFYKRFTVNSASVIFKQKPWWKEPHKETVQDKAYRHEVRKLLEERDKINQQLDTMINLVKLPK